MKYKHIIWDWNGTIINDIDLCVDIMNNLLKEYGLAIISEQEYKQKFTFPVVNYYTSLGFTIEQFKIVGNRFVQEYNSRHYSCRVFPGLSELLEKNKTLGLKQSVLSASKQETLENIVAHFKLSHYFEYISGISDIYASGKIAQGKRLIENIDIAPHEILMIGDTYHDFEISSVLGTDCVLVPHGHASLESIQAHTNKIAYSVDELEKIIIDEAGDESHIMSFGLGDFKS